MLPPGWPWTAGLALGALAGGLVWALAQQTAMAVVGGVPAWYRVLAALLVVGGTTLGGTLREGATARPRPPAAIG